MTATGPGSKAPLSAPHLWRRLVLYYLQGSSWAVGVMLFLVHLGLEFTSRQWWMFLAAVPFVCVGFIIPDIIIMRRHYAPLRLALARLDDGGAPTRAEAEAAVRRALDLPYYSFLRVSLFHGPFTVCLMCISQLTMNAIADAGYLMWQIVGFMGLGAFFAAPTHAIFEFFCVSRCLVPVIGRLYPFCAGFERESVRLNSTGLRKKLLYLAVAVTAMPLLFLAGSVMFKVSMLIARLGAEPQPGQIAALWQWVLGVSVICMGGTLVLALLTGAEVSRSAARLIGAMRSVEGGNLDSRLLVTSTDEYAELYRGFNLMTDGLREEVKILGISNDLAGELKLDLLLARIMQSTSELLDADRSTLWVFDRETGELWTRFAQGVERRELRIPATAGIAGAVFTTGAVENIRDATADPRFLRHVDALTGYQTRNTLAMPVLDKAGQRIGVTQVLNKRGGDFTTRDEQRLRAFTAQLSIALQNARLFDEVLSMKNYNESVLRSSSNGIITLDGSRRIVTVNEAARALLRRDPAKLVNQDGRAVLDPWVLDSLEKVAATGENDTNLDADFSVNGSKISVNLTCVPLLDAARENIGSMLIIDDISSEKRMRSTMSRYMSKEVADQLLESGEEMLGGREQHLTVLFSDIRGFTTLSEAVGARETVQMLNEYFGEMVEVIFAHRGILDKYIGDAIMALFGAPFASPQDADNAMRAANQMIVTLRRLNRTRTAAGKPPIEIGIGLNTGEGVLGSIGSPKRMEYTVIGDTVNLASRIEGVCKTYGVNIVLTQFTLAALEHPVRVRRLDLLRVKGKTQPVAIYEALDHHDAQTFPALDRALPLWEQALAAYAARQWPEARADFAEVLALHPSDFPAKLYLDRCAHFLATPPAENWDGVWAMTHK